MDGRVFECNVLSCADVSSVGYCTVEKASGVLTKKRLFRRMCVGRHGGSKRKRVKTPPDAFQMRRAFFTTVVVSILKKMSAPLQRAQQRESALSAAAVCSEVYFTLYHHTYVVQSIHTLRDYNDSSTLCTLRVYSTCPSREYCVFTLYTAEYVCER